jgi:hypothetical protein
VKNDAQAIQLSQPRILYIRLVESIKWCIEVIQQAIDKDNAVSMRQIRHITTNTALYNNPQKYKTRINPTSKRFLLSTLIIFCAVWASSSVANKP